MKIGVISDTHAPINELVDGVLFLNPGSTSGKFPALHKTYGILSVEKSMSGEIITIE
jgi:predicted phosphodiesterase